MLGGATPPTPPPADDDDKAEAPAAAEASPDAAAAPEATATPDVPTEGAPAADVDTTADDILSSPAFLKKKMEILTKELNQSTTEKEALAATLAKEKDSYLRLAADLDNVRRRSSSQLAAATTSATATVVKKLLPALDNFERAETAAKPSTPGEEKLHTSYQAIQKQLLSAFKDLGVEPLNTVGVAFDPNEHDAINRMESTEYPEGVVCAQLQRGYKGAAGVIRPAVVVVSVGPGPPVAEDAADAAEAADEPDALDVESSPVADVADSVTAADQAKPTQA
ncbi:hypothetical protein MMPV_000853 [Pyropia vietnamensis]